MHTVEMRLVTIIAQDSLIDRLPNEIKQLGAKGYTITREILGSGAHGERVSEWEGENFKLEAIVDEITADRIVTYMAEDYFPDYAVVVYVTPVQVVRGEKFR